MADARVQTDNLARDAIIFRALVRLEEAKAASATLVRSVLIELARHRLANVMVTMSPPPSL